MGAKIKEPSFGEGLVEGLREAMAWKRGEVVLEVVNIEPVQPARASTVRKRLARSARKFVRRFRISAA
jgi:putative transcriptional regulator